MSLTNPLCDCTSTAAGAKPGSADPCYGCQIWDALAVGYGEVGQRWVSRRISSIVAVETRRCAAAAKAHINERGLAYLTDSLEKAVLAQGVQPEGVASAESVGKA